MKNSAMIFFMQITMLLAFSQCVWSQISEAEMQSRLDEYDSATKLLCNAQSKANWDVQTDVGNPEKVQIQNEKIQEYSKYRFDQYTLHWKDASADDYISVDVKRKLMMLKNVGTAALPETDVSNMTLTRNRMSSIYNQARICPYAKQNCELQTEGMNLDPGIEMALSKSESYEEQLYLWEQWREVSGKHMRADYKMYLELYNKAATLNEFNDAGEMWRSRYEDANLVSKVDQLWSEVAPLYNELHTYVRRKLIGLYGDKIDKNDPNIPAHLLGNMWAQNWVNLYERTKPFSKGSSFDITEKMLELNVTVRDMFVRSDEFYKSLGLPSSEMSYGEKSMIERPTDGRDVACHASAWDFCDGEDFRIKMCTKQNMEDFVVVHHEMGHIMYFLLYKDQPLIYRSGANPGFHEAVGDTIALSVATPKHLKAVGLLDNYEDNHENDINALYHMALERVAFLPFGLLIDKWRWNLFSGTTPETEWNKSWWELRQQYQKVSAPSVRGEEFFDPGAKYHIPADSQYIAYFVAHILQFSFYKSLCIEAGEYEQGNPLKQLHKCDYFNNTAAGDKLRAGLSLGLSQHWKNALLELTGESEMSASALLEYFAPLQDFLKAENERFAAMDALLDEYEGESSSMCNKMVTAEWGVATDSNNAANKEIYRQAVLENNNFTREWYTKAFEGVIPDDFPLDIKRQLMHLTKLGRDALSTSDLTILTDTQSGIENIYNIAKVCPYDNQDCDLASSDALSLEPELQEIMATSYDYDKLEYTWTQWREKSGKLMRNGYRTYIGLNNKAAELNGFSDYGEMWREAYEDPDLVKTVDDMWKDVEPLYDELHKYVLRKLKKMYGNKIDVEDGLIPAHVLGNMWAQSWNNLYDKIKPFDGGSSIDITENMKAKNITVEEMFEMSNKFFMDLGLPNNSMSYQEPPAVINKPDRDITCHASAWDFCNGEDFRIKQCTSVDQEDFVTVHHEMGHINYFILYKHLPIVFRTGANPGFHEAVGDLIALSVSTPQHLVKIGLLDDYADTEEDNINALFKMALERVAFLPFGLLIDKFRWDLFSGKTPETEWNKHWWDLRAQYQKIKPPNGVRGEEFFDPGAKYHIPADYQYIAYFIAHILEFQLHRAVCIEAGEYDRNDPAKPLHKCDIDGNKAAGKLIENGLRLGLSQHWSVALKEMTGETEISGEAIFDYFRPLYDYLKKVNEEDDDDDSSSVLIKFNVFLLIAAAFVKIIF